MTRVVADSDEMRRFARALKQVADELRTARTGIREQKAGLGERWRDVRFQKFDSSFGEAVNRLEAFDRRATAYLDYLARKARKVDDYLGG